MLKFVFLHPNQTLGRNEIFNFKSKQNLLYILHLYKLVQGQNDLLLIFTRPANNTVQSIPLQKLKVFQQQQTQLSLIHFLCFGEC